MGKYCKTHNIECEVTFGGYYCRYCGRVLKEDEVSSTKAIVIKYHMNGGEGNFDAQMVQPGQPVTIPQIKPTRNGYEFLGWHTYQNAMVASHKPGFQFLPSDDVTFYAVWKQIGTSTSKPKTPLSPTTVPPTTSEKTTAQKNTEPKRKFNGPLCYGIGTMIVSFALMLVVYDDILLTILGFVFAVGFFMMIIGFCVRRPIQDAAEDKARRERDQNYNNPQWRKEHPAEARLVEEERRREHIRWNGPAVQIPSYQMGYWYRAYTTSQVSHWNNGVPDRAGGWDVRCKISNIGARQIKYVKIVFAAYNAVGDKCYSRINSCYDMKCTYTGPLNPGHTTDWIFWEHLWYDINPRELSIESIHIDFMDGKSQDIDKNGNVTNHGF